jgi:hypothetical protein
MSVSPRSTISSTHLLRASSSRHLRLDPRVRVVLLPEVNCERWITQDAKRDEPDNKEFEDIVV